MRLSRPLGPDDRLHLAVAATRGLGADLLVSVGGATRPVEQLTGSGPDLWRSFAEGLSVGDAAFRLAERTGTDLDVVEPHVTAFATRLVEAGLAEVAP